MGSNPVSTVGYLTRLNMNEIGDSMSVLHHSEDRWPYRCDSPLGMLADAAFDGIFIAEHGIVSAANQGLARIFGYELEDISGLPLETIFGQSSQMIPLLQPSRTSEFHARRKDGSALFIEVCNAELGEGTFIFGIRDITRRRSEEERLMESEARYHDLIAIGHDLVCTHLLDGRVLTANAAVTRVLGIPGDEFQTLTIQEIMAPADRPQYAEYVESLLQRGTARGLMRVMTRDGRTRVWEFQNTLMTTGVDGPFVRGLARDVTERKLLEAQLGQANRLTGLGRLAATVAHEFNNVLMGMQPFAELLRQPNPSPKVLETCAHHLSNSIQRGKRVAQDILRYTQPAAPVISPLNLAAWWKLLSPELHAQLGSQITFNSWIPDDLVVIADALQLSQVFSNLVNNAQDAMHEGGTLTIRAEATSTEERYPFGVVSDSPSFVHLSVSDTGSGISQEIRGQLFDPLFTTKAHGGTGLGLAVAHQVITRHAGHIFVESEVGVGTTFHIFLPRGTVDQPVATLEAPVERIPIRARRLLIVDDELSITEGLREILVFEGFQVGVARTGLEALTAVERFLPDLVVLDIGLPDIDGRDVAKRLRLAHPDLPIIFSTGHADAAELIHYSPARFLRKPFDVDLLLDTIADLESDLLEAH